MAPTARDRETSIVADGELNDELALRPHPGEEHLFVSLENRFAFTTGQLRKLVEPKSLPAFHACGGLQGLERGLRTDRFSGLSVDETDFDDFVTFEEATAHTREPRRDHRKADTDQDVLRQENHNIAIGHNPTTRRPTTSHLPSDQFAARRRVFGKNRLADRKGKSIWRLLRNTWSDKMLVLLTVAALVSLGIGIGRGKMKDNRQCRKVPIDYVTKHDEFGWLDGAAILTTVAIVVIVGTWNDWKRERQFVKLNAKKSDRLVTVIRSGKPRQISVYDIVVGDVVHIEPGEIAPVDGIYISGFNVGCDESSATGESDVVRKVPGDDVYNALRGGSRPDIRKLDPFILSGSQISEGTGSFLATAVGIHTLQGRTMMALQEENETTPLQRKLNILGDHIAKLGGLAALVLFVVLFIRFLVSLRGLSAECGRIGKFMLFLDIFIESVSLVVCAVPEGLPLAVTLALAYATRKMLKDNNFVRRLRACETMGNATTICCDKTGTLTENNMTLVAARLGVDRVLSFREPRANTSGADESLGVTEWVRMLSADVGRLVTQSIVINSSAYENEVNKGVVDYVGSKTETALLQFARQHFDVGPLQEERSNAQIVQVQPFDSGLKFMATAVKLKEDSYRLYVKGAPELMLLKAKHILSDSASGLDTVTLSEADRVSIEKTISHYASQSLRTLAMVYQDFDAWPPSEVQSAGDSTNVDLEKLVGSGGLNWLGVFGIKDPVRQGVAKAVKQCQMAGIVVRMVTGDNYLTARAIAVECGIYDLNSDNVIMEGPMFRNMDDVAVKEVLPRLRVLARSSPEDKRILVKQLLNNGETVAVTGDGTNDAPALHTADVGFSMGVSGTEVAKEASDIVIMDDNFTSIVKAMMWGRAINDSVRKFIQFQLTVNISAVMITFISATTDPESQAVLGAVHLLWLNMIMDTFGAMALATDPPSEALLNRRPVRKSEPLITLRMWKMIIGVAMWETSVLLVLYFVGSKSLVRMARKAGLPFVFSGGLRLRTVVFNTFVWMQVFNLWNCRRLDNGFNIFAGAFRNKWLLGITAVICAGQVLFVMVAGPAVRNTRLGVMDWLLSVGLASGVFSVVAVLRLIPDSLVLRLVPLKRWRRRLAPDRGNGEVGHEETDSRDEDAEIGITNESTNTKPGEGTVGTNTDGPCDVDGFEMAMLRRIRGGRVNSLKVAVKDMRGPLKTGKKKVSWV